MEKYYLKIAFVDFQLYLDKTLKDFSILIYEFDLTNKSLYENQRIHSYIDNGSNKLLNFLKEINSLKKQIKKEEVEKEIVEECYFKNSDLKEEIEDIDLIITLEVNNKIFNELFKDKLLLEILKEYDMSQEEVAGTDKLEVFDSLYYSHLCKGFFLKKLKELDKKILILLEKGIGNKNE
ncbi:MAG: hypothetical protein KGV57_02205 [Fusobacterium sp.]|nr:hypothetical protein [Fusobacterium sp.]